MKKILKSEPQKCKIILRPNKQTLFIAIGKVKDVMAALKNLN